MTDIAYILISALGNPWTAFGFGSLFGVAITFAVLEFLRWLDDRKQRKYGVD